MANRTRWLGWILLLVIGLGLVVGVSGCVRWQEKRIVVQVYGWDPFDPDDFLQPLVGARVSLVGPVVVNVFTDFQGRAETLIPPGYYVLDVMRAGFLPARKVITLYTAEVFPAYYEFQLVPDVL